VIRATLHGARHFRQPAVWILMGIGIHSTGAAPSWWSSEHDSALQELYANVTRQFGAEAAERAVRDAQYALNDAFHKMMIRFGGDEMHARSAVLEMTPDITRLASLIPAIKSNDTTRAGVALREARGLLARAGMSDQAMVPWLKAHVASDDVLRAAGFDPADVRRPSDTPWAHADLDALVALARDMLERYRDANGKPIPQEQIDAYLDQARAAANRLGVGSARAPGAEPRDPAGSMTVAAFSFPRRV
jgi:hypothetical protein